jgi:hypothetical protein
MRIKVVSRCGIEHSLPDDKTVVYRPGWEFVHARSCKDYDWLVVFDEMPGNEMVCCHKEQTILCTWEPVTIKSYSRAYVSQFGHLLTNRPFAAEKHPGYRLGRGYFPSYTRRGIHEDIGFVPPEKKFLISTVCSAKNMRHTDHNKRLKLISGVKSRLPELDWYGRGVKPIKEKSDALNAYKYHIAVENHIAPYHWSEKISDALISECLPFYAGDPNLGEVLPPESFIPIPIDDPEKASEIIKAAISNDEYSRRLPAIKEARRLIHEKYNFYAQVISLIEDSSGLDSSVGRKNWMLYSRKNIRLRHPMALLEEGWRHLVRMVKMI